MRLPRGAAVAASLLLQLPAAKALQVTVGNETSIKSAASTVAYGLMKYYTGNNTGDVPGNLPDPYFWWEAGALFGTLIDYWFLTGDETYNNITTQAILHQVGDNRDFMPRNQTLTEGNDDQGFWALAAMSAAENKYPDPPADQPQWLALAQAVFNQYVTRWDMQNCNGGLRWQIFTFNNGFNYKNSISNGCFFNLAARLARFTGNQTYADWAEKVWDWQTNVGLITPDFDIYDGASIEGGLNCTKPDLVQWTYNAGIFMHGSAYMYNLTDSDKWKSRVQGILDRSADIFYNGTVMVEPGCEYINRCNNDERSFKGFLTRWLAGTSQLAPFTQGQILPLLDSNAEAVSRVCTGTTAAPAFKGVPGTACGFSWTGALANSSAPAFDGSVGVGEQMTALSALMYTLVARKGADAVPVTSTTGGTSQGNPNAGLDTTSPMTVFEPITTGDRVAAGFVTTGLVLSVIGGSFFLLK